jgi:hypothetical protein
VSRRFQRRHGTDEGFGWYTSPIKACSAKVVEVDYDDPSTMLGRMDRSRIAARSAANDDNVGIVFLICHCCSLKFARK